MASCAWRFQAAPSTPHSTRLSPSRMSNIFVIQAVLLVAYSQLTATLCMVHPSEGTRHHVHKKVTSTNSQSRRLKIWLRFRDKCFEDEAMLVVNQLLRF